MTTTQSSPSADAFTPGPGAGWVALMSYNAPDGLEAHVIAPSVVKWSGEIDGARVTATWAVTATDVECVGLNISGPVRSDLLRTLGLDGKGRQGVEALAVGRRSVSAYLVPDQPLPSWWTQGATVAAPTQPTSLRRAADSLSDTRGRSRRVLKGEVEAAAEAYVAAVQQGMPPVEAVMAELDLDNRRTADRRISAARRAGLIPASSKRPAPWTDAQLREVAQTYMTAKHAPVKAVAELLGKTTRTAARAVAEARRKGLLDRGGEN